MDMKNFAKFIKSVDLTDYTLIIPSVSVGNVPQLTIDVLISTYKLVRTAILWHPAIIPSVASDPFEENSTDVTTACELYTNEKLKVAVMQLRSSIDKQFANSFFENIVICIQACKINAIVILTSTFAQDMHDIKASYYRCLCTNSTAVTDKMLEDLSILRGNEAELHNGTGYALKLYQMCEAANFSTTLLCKYTSEGDNRPDAIQMLGMLEKLVSNFEGVSESVQYPISWDLVFGNPPPIGIY